LAHSRYKSGKYPVVFKSIGKKQKMNFYAKSVFDKIDFDLTVLGVGESGEIPHFG